MRSGQIKATVALVHRSFILILIYVKFGVSSAPCSYGGDGLSIAVAGQRTQFSVTSKETTGLSSLFLSRPMLIMTLHDDEHDQQKIMLSREDATETLLSGYLITRAGSYKLAITPYTCKFRLS